MNKSSSIKINAFKIKQPIGEFLIGSISAEALVGISYADIRRLEQRDVEKYLGIQRPLSKNRVQKIKEYIDGNDAVFPTSIILAVDEKCAEFDETRNVLTLSAYSPGNDIEDEAIEFDKIAKILDGQHRIAGFVDEDDNYCFNYEDRSFEINVAIFIGIDISEQANIFSTVNLAQTKVNRSLVYDLEALSKVRSPHKTCHLVTVALNARPESPLFERIKRLGVATPKREFEPLTQAAVVEALVKFISSDPLKDRRILLSGKKLPPADHLTLMKFPFRNLFIGKEDTVIYEIIFNYFSAIKSKWPKAWENINVKGNLLPKTNAFKAFMAYLKNDVYLDLVGDDIGKIPTVEEFLPYLKHVKLNDKDFTTKNFAPGSGGQSTFYKVLKGEIDSSELFLTE